MISAFFYLQLTTLRNRLVQRFKRLRQPRYFFGAIFGAAYFYFFFFRKVINGFFDGGVHPPSPAISPELGPYLISFGGLLLFVIVSISWVLPSSRAALHFTEAEVAFLFPAPITRKRLIHFKLLRSQIAILISTFFLSLIFRRASYLGGNALMHAAGWWLILSTLSLHFIAASFARERLLSLGVHPNRRRAVAAVILVALVGGSIAWLRSHVAPPATADFANTETLIRYFGNLLQSPPVGWILAPFALVVRPYFASNPASFLAAIGPSLLVMAIHYWWVVNSDVSFEEASIDQARKRAEQVTAMHAGEWPKRKIAPGKPRPAPFELAGSGNIPMAFLWKNLVAMGPFFRIRTWLIFVAFILGFHVWAKTTHLSREIYGVIAAGSLGLGAWLLIVGPMFMRQNVRLMVTHFDLLKGYPLRGWQIVLGSLTSPILILAASEWLLLMLGAPILSVTPRAAMLGAGLFAIGGLGIAVILPPLTGMMLSIPFAATLYFPAWIENSGARGGGIEVMGQRLIFFAGYVIVLLMALLPAVICGGIAAFALNWIVGKFAAVVAATLVGSVILTGEFIATVWWLGERFERFDLSHELPR